MVSVFNHLMTITRFGRGEVGKEGHYKTKFDSKHKLKQCILNLEKSAHPEKNTVTFELMTGIGFRIS